MADFSATTTTRVHEPIHWCGFNDDGVQRLLFFKGDDGVRLQVPADAALRQGMFDWGTSTPERRDALRAWASDPEMFYPPALVETA